MKNANSSLSREFEMKTSYSSPVVQQRTLRSVFQIVLDISVDEDFDMCVPVYQLRHSVDDNLYYTYLASHTPVLK